MRQDSVYLCEKNRITKGGSHENTLNCELFSYNLKSSGGREVRREDYMTKHTPTKKERRQSKLLITTHHYLY